MNEFQFCYWLMGVFELGKLKELNSKHLVLINEHLKLVEYREHTFSNWLEGVLDMKELEHMSKDKTEKVLQKLRQEFLNVIDRSYPQELWKPLQDAHNGKPVKIEKPKPPAEPRFEAMC